MKRDIAMIFGVVGVMVLGGCTQQVASPKPGTDGTMVSSETVVLDSAVSGSREYTNEQSNGKQSVHFAYDSNKLNQEERSKIARDASALKAKGIVKVEGNSDEFGTDEYNYALGLRRAKATKDAMVARGVPAKKIKVLSYGESNPECTDKTKACYQKNRRADYE